jgi:hypothetical protein
VFYELTVTFDTASKRSIIKKKETKANYYVYMMKLSSNNSVATHRRIKYKMDMSFYSKQADF